MRIYGFRHEDLLHRGELYASMWQQQLTKASDSSEDGDLLESGEKTS